MNGNGNGGAFKEFNDHRLVAYINDEKVGLSGFIAIHRGSINNPAFGATRLLEYHHTPAFGATRLAEYSSEMDALADALKLSRLMSYKAAMAGLRYGGAKGVIIKSPKQKDRKSLLKTYAERVNYFGGRFITGADVGIDRKDVKIMSSASPFFVGISTDPVVYTAHGLFLGIRASLKASFGSDEIDGRSFAIQGTGKIGTALLHLIYKDAKEIFVADVNTEALKIIKKKYPKVIILSPKDIYRPKVDVFSPCALSNSLNSKTIAKLRAKIIAGGANNQLASPEIGELLHQLGILYAPDYVINAGGLISVVDEYEHKDFNHDRIIKRVNKIEESMSNIFAEAKKQNRATNLVSDQMAEKIFNNK